MSRPTIKQAFLESIATGSLKSLTVNLLDRILPGRGMRWDSNSFFMDMGGLDSDAGITVSADRALNYTAYWSCVTRLTQDVASLPCHLKERLGERNTVNAANNPLYKLLHDAPNPEMDSFSYFESLMYHLIAANGNAYSYIDWDETLTEIKALWLMDPERTSKIRLDNGEIGYRYQSEKAGQLTLPAYRVWHVPGFGYDGLKGYTPLTYARNLIGRALGAEKMGAKLFANGLTIGGYFEHPGVMTEEAQKRFLANKKSEHQGVDKAWKGMILEEGMKFHNNNINPGDAQMLETEDSLYTRMASFFHIPPHKIGDMKHATFSNIEEQNIEYAVDTLRPWCIRIERSGNRQLLLETLNNKLFIKFNLDGLLRGDFESRMRGYAIGRNWGLYSINDCLELEDRNGIGTEGDVHLQPLNMIPADKFNNTLPTQPNKPAPPAKE